MSALKPNLLVYPKSYFAEFPQSDAVIMSECLLELTSCADTPLRILLQCTEAGLLDILPSSAVLNPRQSIKISLRLLSKKLYYTFVNIMVSSDTRPVQPPLTIFCSRRSRNVNKLTGVTLPPLSRTEALQVFQEPERDIRPALTIKRLHKRVATQAEKVTFRQEVALLSQIMWEDYLEPTDMPVSLNHIIHINHAEETDDFICLSFEHHEHTLRSLVHAVAQNPANFPLPEHTIALFLLQISQALIMLVAFPLPVLFRDLSPENIGVVATGSDIRLKINHMGTSSPLGPNATIPPCFLEFPDSMSHVPQLVYNIGLILFELITLQPPPPNPVLPAAAAHTHPTLAELFFRCTIAATDQRPTLEQAVAVFQHILSPPSADSDPPVQPRGEPPAQSQPGSRSSSASKKPSSKSSSKSSSSKSSKSSKSTKSKKSKKPPSTPQ